MTKVIERYEFTCRANSIVAGRRSFYKGQRVVVYGNDPKLPWFRQNNFTEKPLPPLTEAEESAQKNQDSLPSDPMVVKIYDLKGFSGPIKAALRKAGVETVGDVLGMTKDELVTIEGIGEASADKLLTVCQAVVKSKE